MYDTTGTLISMDRFQKIEVDIESETVRVGAGVSFAKLAAFLAEQNLAIETLPSLVHQRPLQTGLQSTNRAFVACSARPCATSHALVIHQQCAVERQYVSGCLDA